jgi:polysaccharide deacetylase family protein (PEP-CTERM system associated)
VISGIERLPLRQPAVGAPVAALTVDVEDWFQSCVDLSAPISRRVVANTARVLETLDEAGVKATFFVQGLVAQAHPGLVAELVAGGHEVQAHAHTHRSLTEMDHEQLREEIRRGKAAVEDAAGVTVTAFRAPDFSIGSANLWALDVLTECGFELDSSIFPMERRRYGIAGWETAPHQVVLDSGRRLTEVPVSVREVGTRRLPVAGGGYFRVGPYAVLSRSLRAIIRQGRPPIVYCHPYEFSADELDDYRSSVPWRFRAQQGLGRRAFVERLRRLLDELSFGRLDQVLSAWGVRPPREAAVL